MINEFVYTEELTLSNYAHRPGSRPPQRRRKKQSPAALILVLGIIVAAIVLIIIFATRGGGDSVAPAPTEAPAVAQDSSTAPEGAAATDAPASTGSSLSDITAMLDNETGVITPLDDSERVQVSAEDLSVNPNLPSEWRNILLLGSDGHTEIESARTDAMMICSINTTTGEVKLCSIMRDMAVEIPDRGLYKINSANFWGGPWLAVKLVNECFNMNIEDYAMVNFFGFQQVADYLGGIDIDITKEEMEQIDKNVGEQIRLAREAGIDESNLPQEHLTTYGENTHLDGRQTLGYARIRKLAGEDFGRTERQRKVLMALLEKMMGTPPLEITRMAANLFEYFNTSLTAQEAITIASQVLSSGLTDVETLYLPQNGTYSPDTRNNTYMMYDVDYQTNANALYEFIYN